MSVDSAVPREDGRRVEHGRAAGRGRSARRPGDAAEPRPRASDPDAAPSRRAADSPATLASAALVAPSHRLAVARRLDGAIALFVLVLGLGTLALWYGSNVQRVVEAPALDIVINVTATLVSAAVATLAWVRWRETAEPAALYECSAFVALAATNGYLLLVVLAGRAGSIGLAASAPTAGPVYLWTLTRLTAAILLVIGGLRGVSRQLGRLPPAFIAIVPGACLLLIALMFDRFAAAAPRISGLDEVLFPAASSSQATGAVDVGGQPFGSAVIALGQLGVAIAFSVAAWHYRALFRRDGVLGHAFLAAGLVVAAFSQLHFAVDPVVTAGIVTSADILRLGFAAILFLGIEAEFQSELGSLRRANAELERLRDVGAANAALAERARLAREIHDGLAQDLWYAKLKQSRLTSMPSLPEDMKTTAREVAAALDSALAEARQAVMAMRTDPGAAGLGAVLERYVADFGDRFGLRVAFEAADDVPPLPVRAEAEILRIVQEALNNCRKHADAALVRVRVAVEEGRLRVTIADNGRGFDAAKVPNDRFGLRSMNERAALVGGDLTIESAPSDGTRVCLEVPLAQVGARAAEEVGEPT